MPTILDLDNPSEINRQPSRLDWCPTAASLVGKLMTNWPSFAQEDGVFESHGPQPKIMDAGDEDVIAERAEDNWRELYDLLHMWGNETGVATHHAYFALCMARATLRTRRSTRDLCRQAAKARSADPFLDVVDSCQGEVLTGEHLLGDHPHEGAVLMSGGVFTVLVATHGLSNDENRLVSTTTGRFALDKLKLHGTIKPGEGSWRM